MGELWVFLEMGNWGGHEGEGGPKGQGQGERDLL